MEDINWQDEAEVTIELTPDMEKLFIETFGIEIEMMQGEIAQMDDGRKRFKIKVKGEKAEMIGKFVLRIISRPDTIQPN